MESLTLVTLLIIFSNSYGLSCLTTDDGKHIEMSLKVVNSGDIIKTLEELDFSDYDDGSLCRIELYIDHDAKNFFIKLTEELQESRLQGEDVQIDIFANGYEIDDFSITHYLEYACSDDECELDFVKKYIDWFIDANYPELPDQLIPFIFDDGKEAGE